MKRIGKFLALLAVSASTIVAIPAAPAFAGGDGVGYSQRYQDIRDWRRDGNRYYGGRQYYGRHGQHNRRYYRRHNNNGNAAAALGLGLAIGAVTAGAIASSRAPAPQYYNGGGLEPWSPGWYRYCEDKYRSFNARTGTYRGYDGRDHFCNAP